MIGEEFKVKTEVFEGPLDLLLNLIEKRKLFVNDISLSKVADDYIAYVRELGVFPTSDSANFILIASTLVLIKSKSLLPSINLTEEEETSIEDLERRLKLYKEIKELSIHVKERFGKNVVFFKSSSKNIEPVFSPHDQITLNSIFHSIQGVVNGFPKPDRVPKATVKKVISLEETIEKLTSRIQTSFKVNFNEFSNKDKEEKVNVIVSFLAVLELVKQGIVAVRQETNFEDISIETNKVDIPHYN